MEEEQLANVKMFPNPVTDKLTITGEQGIVSLKDMNGRIINSFNHNSHSTIDCSDLNAGVYFLELRNDQGSYTQKIIK